MTFTCSTWVISYWKLCYNQWRWTSFSIQLCSFCSSVTQLAALTPQDLAAILVCNRSSGGSGPAWKLLLSKASHVLDAALDLLTNAVRINTRPPFTRFLIRTTQSMFIISSLYCCCCCCRLWTPGILRFQWFWTSYEKFDWTCLRRAASTTPPSSSCGSKSAFERSSPPLPPTSSRVSPPRGWTAPATSTCEQHLRPVPIRPRRLSESLCVFPLRTDNTTPRFVSGCGYWATCGHTWHSPSRFLCTRTSWRLSWAGTAPRVSSRLVL